MHPLQTARVKSIRQISIPTTSAAFQRRNCPDIIITIATSLCPWGGILLRRAFVRLQSLCLLWTCLFAKQVNECHRKIFRFFLNNLRNTMFSCSSFVTFSAASETRKLLLDLKKLLLLLMHAWWSWGGMCQDGSCTFEQQNKHMPCCTPGTAPPSIIITNSRWNPKDFVSLPYTGIIYHLGDSCVVVVFG